MSDTPTEEQDKEKGKEEMDEMPPNKSSLTNSKDEGVYKSIDSEDEAEANKILELFGAGDSFVLSDFLDRLPEIAQSLRRLITDYDWRITELETENKWLKGEVIKLSADGEQREKDLSEWQHSVEIHRKDILHRVNKHDFYISERSGNSKRDSFSLAQKLAESIARDVLRRKKFWERASVNYVDVKKILGYKSDNEAYRMMEKTMPTVFPDWFVFLSNKRPKLLKPTEEFAEHVFHTSGEIWRVV